MAKTKIGRHEVVIIAAAMFIAGFVLGSNFRLYQHAPEMVDLGEERVVSMLMPAVDSEGNGVIGTLYTTVKPGMGKIFLDTSMVLNYIDTQLSGRTAARAASEYANINLSNIDITYTIRVNASIVEGPSAGASMAISVLLALENRTANNIAMTGTINPDGTVGRVGSVLEKAQAAKKAGAVIFLVPKGQSTSDQVNREQACSANGYYEICRVKYNKKSIDISTYIGMKVYEVGDIGEAYSYFIGPTS